MTNAPTRTTISTSTLNPPPPVAQADTTPNRTMAHSADDRAEAAPHVQEPRPLPATDMTGVQYKPDDDTLRLVAESCARKVEALLAREPETKLLRAVQQQVRIAMGVIEEAMGRYRYVGHCIASCAAASSPEAARKNWSSTDASSPRD